MRTQPDRVLDYLKERKSATSNELRSYLRIVDVPKAVSILVSRGVPITSKRNRDGSSTYYYDRPVPQEIRVEDFDWSTGTAIPKKTEQGVLL